MKTTKIMGLSERQIVLLALAYVNGMIIALILT